MINFELEIGDEIYNKARKQNGKVLLKYLEECNGRYVMYYCAYSEGGKTEYEWEDKFGLDKGHRGDVY